MVMMILFCDHIFWFVDCVLSTNITLTLFWMIRNTLLSPKAHTCLLITPLYDIYSNHSSNSKQTCSYFSHTHTYIYIQKEKKMNLPCCSKPYHITLLSHHQEPGWRIWGDNPPEDIPGSTTSSDSNPKLDWGKGVGLIGVELTTLRYSITNQMSAFV